MEVKSPLRATSHCLIAADDVLHLTRFFSRLFRITPHFENDAFSEFVLPSRFRIAFFKPVGKSARFFQSGLAKGTMALGLTVHDVEAVFRRAGELQTEWKIEFSGAPKEHPWGEKSFLLLDPEKNRWEITQSPSADGMLVDRE